MKPRPDNLRRPNSADAFLAVAAAVAVFCSAAAARGTAGESLFDRTTPPSVAKKTLIPEHTKLFTSNASTAGQGVIELEFSYNYWRTRRFTDDAGNSFSRGLAREHSVDLAANYGLTSDLDVGVDLSYFWIRDDWNDYDGDGWAGPVRGENLGDVSFWSKWRFYGGGDSTLALAYVGGFTAPAGTDDTEGHIGTSQGYWSVENTLVITKDVGRWSTSANVGYSVPIGSDRAESRGVLNADIAGGYQLLDWLHPEVELLYSHEYLDKWDDPEVISAVAGAVFTFNPRTRLSVGVVQDFWSRNSSLGFGLVGGLKLSF